MGSMIDRGSRVPRAAPAWKGRGGVGLVIEGSNRKGEGGGGRLRLEVLQVASEAGANGFDNRLRLESA
jgi:hypothetical protein